MATYAIGDIQGCFDELLRLLDEIRFDPAADRVWFTGDLVNRGTQSLEVLRFVRSLGERAVTVLGNHDLHLLAVAHGAVTARSKDTFFDVLESSEGEVLMHWLQQQPLLHHDATLGFTLVHAGLPPQWDLTCAQSCAREVEAVLRGPRGGELFTHMYGDGPDAWSEGLDGWERLRYIVNCFTRMRYCDAGGRLALRHKLGPGTQPEGFHPWFAVPRASAEMSIIFGHWSTLGRHHGHGVIGLDTGCVWGGALTAFRIEDGAWFGVSCEGACAPGED